MTNDLRVFIRAINPGITTNQLITVETIMTNTKQLQVTEEFNTVWIRMVGEGWCEVFGGGEYRRVLADYLTNGNGREIEEFIRYKV